MRRYLHFYWQIDDKLTKAEIVKITRLRTSARRETVAIQITHVVSAVLSWRCLRGRIWTIILFVHKIRGTFKYLPKLGQYLILPENQEKSLTPCFLCLICDDF